MNKRLKQVLGISGYLLLLGITILAAASSFSSYFNDKLKYNAIGYITDNSYCRIHCSDLGCITSGRIDLTFQLAEHENASFINASASASEQCSGEVCCQDWLGELLYIEASLEENNSYTIDRISPSDKIHSTAWLLLGIGGVATAFVMLLCLACYLALRLDRHKGYLTVSGTT